MQGKTLAVARASPGPRSVRSAPLPWHAEQMLGALTQPAPAHAAHVSFPVSSVKPILLAQRLARRPPRFRR